jgi:xylan 1,4-beta-xylosidase
MKLPITVLLLFGAITASAQILDVKIAVDARRPGAELTPIFRFFGADEPNYATMKDGGRLLGELGKLRKDDVYFRAHSLLSSGDGTPALKWGSTNVYTEEAGEPRYDWRVIDGIFDAYLSNGVRPYVQLGFMPQALSSAPPSVPYRHTWRPGFDYNLIHGGWAYPPICPGARRQGKSLRIPLSLPRQGVSLLIVTE